MPIVINQSLYPVQAVERHFWHGNPYLCVSAKVTLAFDTAGRLSRLERQPPLALDEVWLDRPMRSSLVHAGDHQPFKPGTDVLVVGSARAPGGRPAESWDAEIVMPGRRKRLRFVGPRVWEHRLLSGWTLSRPHACDAIPLLYENAYGGVVDPLKEHFDEGEFYPDNPFGTGFVGGARPRTDQPIAAAQIEAWDGAITSFGKDVAVGGTGPVPGFFPSRARYAGNWDAHVAAAAPGMPLDMDMRYWQVAPPDQQLEKALRENDEIALIGFCATGPLQLRIPPISAMTTARYSDRNTNAMSMPLDTVMIDLDRRQVSFRYHVIVPLEDTLERVSVHCAQYRALSGELAHG
jgi:hypothetical protein